jgi:biopolymer transport protein ExbD
MSVGGSSGGVKSDINVTPLVDVVLVLLIIFLVTMPIIMRDLPLEIPRKLENVEQEVAETQVVVERFSDGRTLLDGVEIQKMEISAKVADALKTKRDKVVFVGFDDDVLYGDAVQVVDAVRGAIPGTEIKVALKMKDPKAATPAEGTPGQPTP